MKRCLCVHLLNWPIQRLVVQRPELRRKHILLFRRDSRRGQLVAAASPLALRDGVHVDMPLSEAKSLLRRTTRNLTTRSNLKSSSSQSNSMSPGSQPVSPSPLPNPELNPQYKSSHRRRLRFSPGSKVHPRDQHAEVARQASSLSQWEQIAAEQDVVAKAHLAISGSAPAADSQATSRQPAQDSRSRKVPTSSPLPARAFYVFEHNPIRDREQLEAFCETLGEFSPIVGLDQVPAPDSLFLDITGLVHLFGSEIELADQVGQHCTQRGLHARLGIADTLRLAWGTALFATNADEPVGILPTLPARNRPSSQAFQKPARQETDPEVEDSESCENLDFASDRSLQTGSYPESDANSEVSKPVWHTNWEAWFPIEAFRLPGSTNETLRQLGLTTVRDLLSIPRGHLTSRFGEEILLAVDQLTGEAEEPIIAYRPPPDFCAEQFIEYPTNDRETIEVILTRLIEQICRTMKAEQKGALEWTIRLGCVEAMPVQFQVHLFQPSTSASHVVALAQMQLESALQPHMARPAGKSDQKSKPPTGARRFAKTGRRVVRQRTQLKVQEVMVSASNSVLLVERQRKLFDENPRLDKQNLAHLINRLTSRLGKERVLYPRFQSGAQPEYAVRYRPLADPHRSPPTRKATGSHVLERPLRLLNPPVQLQISVADQRVRSNEADPESADPQRRWAESIQLPPERFMFHRTHTVQNQWGPERIETGWWRGPTVRRDYWRVETDSGHQFWIYQDLRSQAWFLHGEF